MRKRVLVMAIALCGPAVLASQAPRPVTLRAAVGGGNGYGGRHTGREMTAYTVAVDVATRDSARSGPLWGFGWSHFATVPVERFAVADLRCVLEGPCGGSSPTPFPDVNVGFADIGWRAMSGGFRTDVLFQPGIVLSADPTVFIATTSGGLSVSHRLVGRIGIELGFSGTYITRMHSERLGLTQFAVGLRSW